MLRKPEDHGMKLIAGTPFADDKRTYTLFADGDLEVYEYTGWIDESMSWKNTCYIGDWSTLGKILVKGPRALELLSSLSINSFVKFDVGQAKHIVMCVESGHVAGEGVVLRLSEYEFLITSSPATKWIEIMAATRFSEMNVEITQCTDDYFILQLQGPNSLSVIEKATERALHEIGFMRFESVSIKGIEFFALRQGMSGEVGFELIGPSSKGPELYESLLDAGMEFGIRQLGGRTKMVNHVEACFPTVTVDFLPAVMVKENEIVNKAMRISGSQKWSSPSDLFRTPVELGWGKSIKFDHTFVGSEALKKEVENPSRKMVTLVWDSEDIVEIYASLFRKGDVFEPMELPRNLLNNLSMDTVEIDGKNIGISTSRCYSYFFREMISLCTIDIAYSALGTEVKVLWGDSKSNQKWIKAKVAAAPYKRDNRRNSLATMTGRDQDSKGKI